MRRSPFETQRSATALLLGINVAVFLVELVFYFAKPGALAVSRHYLALSNDGVASGYVWQLLTYQFLHSLPWPWHLVFNGLGLFFFGRAVEDALGKRTFLKLYFLSGTLGGLLQLLVGWLVPAWHGASVVGASAGVMGLIAAYATLFPERQITLLLFFVIPVSLKARYLLWGAGLLSLWGTLQPTDKVAHAAHLGGLLAGVVYLRWGMQAEAMLLARTERRARPRPRELVKVHTPKSSAWQQRKPGSPETLSPDEFISREVDPILDKISAHGIQSLTPRERQILEAARSRMGRR